MKHEIYFDSNGRFTISEDFVFISERRELMQNSSGKVITLQTPASRCLTLLLCNHGVIISQSTLIRFGWGEKLAPTITSNAFYQTISYLRRTLKDIGCGEIITTVPRMGLTINLSVKVRQVNAGNNIVQNEDDEHPVDPIEKQPVPVGVSTKKEGVVSKKSAISIYNLSLIILALLLLTWSLLLLPVNGNDNNLQLYKIIDQDKCIIKSPDEINKNKLDLMIVKNNIPCENKGILFITATKQRKSFINCKQYDKKAQICDLTIVIKDK